MRAGMIGADGSATTSGCQTCGRPPPPAAPLPPAAPHHPPPPPSPPPSPPPPPPPRPPPSPRPPSPRPPPSPRVLRPPGWRAPPPPPPITDESTDVQWVILMGVSLLLAVVLVIFCPWRRLCGWGVHGVCSGTSHKNKKHLRRKHEGRRRNTSCVVESDTDSGSDASRGSHSDGETPSAIESPQDRKHRRKPSAKRPHVSSSKGASGTGSSGASDEKVMAKACKVCSHEPCSCEPSSQRPPSSRFVADSSQVGSASDMGEHTEYTPREVHLEEVAPQNDLGGGGREGSNGEDPPGRGGRSSHHKRGQRTAGNGQGGLVVCIPEDSSTDRSLREGENPSMTGQIDTSAGWPNGEAGWETQPKQFARKPAGDGPRSGHSMMMMARNLNI
eukprot:jgi/Mesvir1/17278/Mv07686-RA.1